MLFAMPGAGRLWSNSIIPAWFLEKIGLEGPEVVAEIKKQFVRSPGTEESYLIECEQAVRPMLMVKDWKTTGACDEYGPYALYIDKPKKPILRMCKLCAVYRTANPRLICDSCPRCCLAVEEMHYHLW